MNVPSVVLEEARCLTKQIMDGQAALPLADLARPKSKGASLPTSRAQYFCDKSHLTAKMMSSEQILERAAQDGHIEMYASSNLAVKELS